MADVYDFCSKKCNEAAIKRSVDTLDKGVVYKVEKFDQLVTRNGPEKCLIAHISDEDVKFFVFMPRKFNDLAPELLQQLNKDIEKKKAPGICFYGKLGVANIVEIHKHGQDVNGQLLEKIEKMETKLSESTSMKRKGDHLDSSSKYARYD